MKARHAFWLPTLILAVHCSRGIFQIPASMNPAEVEHYAYYRSHLGPRCEAAGVRVQFQGNQTPGIHFKASPPEEYRGAILKGLREGLDLRFPGFLKSGSLWVTEVTVHEVDSCERAFYLAARLVIDQAHSLLALRQAQRDLERSKVPSAPTSVFPLVEEIRQRMRSVPFVPFGVRLANRLEYPVPTANHIHVFPGQQVLVSDDDGDYTVLPGISISELI